MPLKLPGAESAPFLRYGASINSWQISDADGKPVEIPFDKPAAFDIKNIQLGWMWIAEGQYEWRPWPNNEQQPKPAEGDWKAGFSMEVFSTQFGDEHLREFNSSATGSVMFIQDLYNEAEQHPEFEEGKTPVIKITGSTPKKVGKGNTRIPKFEILKWVPRPEAFSPIEPPAKAPAKAAAKPAAKSAPAPAPAPAGEPEGEEEF